MGWIALLAALVLLTAAQEWFLETHRRRYGLWRPLGQRRFWAAPDERRLMWNAFVHRNDDPHVELSRLALVGALVLFALTGLALLASARVSAGG